MRTSTESENKTEEAGTGSTYLETVVYIGRLYTNTNENTVGPHNPDRPGPSPRPLLFSYSTLISSRTLTEKLPRFHRGDEGNMFAAVENDGKFIFSCLNC